MTDYIGTVEAAYDLTSAADDWLQTLGASVRLWLDRGLGVMLWGFDTSKSGALRVDQPALIGCPDSYAEYVSQAACAITPTGVARTYGSPRLAETISEALAHDEATYAVYRMAAPPEAPDYLAVKARSPDGTGVLLGAPLPSLTRLRPAERKALTQVAVHVAAAYRLRRALEGRALSETDERVEAILAPDGRVEHATEPAKAAAARHALRQHAQAIDRARSRLRGEPTEALALWKGLVAGRWSLVDRFDSDGRRYLIALKNDPTVHDPRALTLRERQAAGFAALGLSNKLIAYTLGISAAAVSLHLKRACQKLNLSARAELVTLFAASGHG
jgi:DNA-binding CsgD family transcriptional regulator